jgi:hypothetical protein
MGDEATLGFSTSDARKGDESKSAEGGNDNSLAVPPVRGEYRIVQLPILTSIPDMVKRGCLGHGGPFRSLPRPWIRVAWMGVQRRSVGALGGGDRVRREQNCFSHYHSKPLKPTPPEVAVRQRASPTGDQRQAWNGRPFSPPRRWGRLSLWLCLPGYFGR